MKLPLRYQVMQSIGACDNVESNIVPTELQAELDPIETALVLVDTWGEHPIASHHERTSNIIKTRIRPALDAARTAGITPIYAPSPKIARQYTQWIRFAGVADFHPPPPPTNDWPPSEYRRLSGPYASLVRKPGELPATSTQHPQPWHEIRTIHASIEPRPNDFVVASGDQLHRILKARRLVHLIFVGFAANICVQFRDYGMRAMRDRGYHPILLRDATTAIETCETYDRLAITDLVVKDLERWFFTASVTDFTRACQNT